jgi:eukaryotic-like serine/threonine-protein kinase
MPESPKEGSKPVLPAAQVAQVAQPEEERLAHALVSRGLLTREEAQQCISGASAGADSFLGRLVKAGLLTLAQARRARQELTQPIGQKIPGYELLEKIGQGSSGIVYKARQLSMNRLVAVKVLHPRVAANPDYLKRLTREAHLAAKLSHNNIIQAIDVGSAGDLHYFVMEYVEGTTLKQELEARKRYSEKEAVDIGLQIAQALQHAARRGLIHRDVKPANIVLTPDGIAKLADLGMARDTADAAVVRAEKGLTIGTPFYIAPEQIEGKDDIDVRADIYSLGATLYHLVTGRPPFPGTKASEVMEAHLEQELTPPDHINTDLSSGFGEVVEFMMAKDRHQRYQKPDDLILDLECLLTGEAPKLAHQRTLASSLEALAQGEEDKEERSPPSGWKVDWWWLAILGAALGLSVLLNLILLAMR